MIDDVYVLERKENFQKLINKYFEKNLDQKFADESIFILMNIET